MAALKDSDCRCPLCSYNATTIQSILSHIRAFHANDPNFCVPCGLDGCATSLRSFSALYSHVYRHHSEFIKKRGNYLSVDTGDSSQVASGYQHPFVTDQGKPCKVN